MEKPSVLEYKGYRVRKASWKVSGSSMLFLLRGTGLNFFRFLNSLGMSGERNLVILTSRDSYSCGEKELKNAKVLVNLRMLNLIKHPDLFLNVLVRILPPGTNFIGCFSDAKKENAGLFSPGIAIKMRKWLKGFFESERRHVMDREEVIKLLENNGFRTFEMKELNGLTYFRSQNIYLPA